jgi:hypothetical protein
MLQVLLFFFEPEEAGFVHADRPTPMRAGNGLTQRPLEVRDACSLFRDSILEVGYLIFGRQESPSRVTFPLFCGDDLEGGSGKASRLIALMISQSLSGSPRILPQFLHPPTTDSQGRTLVTIYEGLAGPLGIQ